SLGDTGATDATVATAVAPAAVIAEQPVSEPASIPAPEAAPAAAAPSGAVSAAVQSRLLEIVADQTGYAADMLDLSMGVEGDLGIDSIKRVQILGALKDSFPAAPMIGPDELGEIQTLGDIVTLVAGSLATPTTTASSTTAVPSTIAAPSTTASTIGQPVTELAAPETISPSTAPESPQFPPPAFADGIIRGRLGLRELSEPDRLLLPTGQVAVIVDDGQLGRPLAYALQTSGWRVHLLTVPGVAALPGAHSLSNWSQAEVTAKIEAVVAAEGTLHLCAYLAGAPVGDLAAAQQRLLHALSTARAATPGLETGPDRSLFLAVTALDGAFGTQTPVSTESAVLSGVSGLVKTLAVESPTVSARYVDLAADLTLPQIAAFLLAEVEDPDRGLREVGRSADRRVTWQITPDDGTGDRTAALTSDDVLVVTGGGRGVTAACAVELARRHQPTLLLLGRSGIEAEPGWATGVPLDGLRRAAVEALRAAGQKPNPRDIERSVRSITASREIQATLAAIRSHGGRAEYLPVDVSAAAETRTALAPYRDRITGVVHGAGVLHDELVAKADTAKAAQVLDVKLGGLAGVLAAVDGPALRHVVLFSSVAGLFGNRGQASYAMANEALNRLVPALRGTHPGLHVTSVNWGAWAGGMVSPELAAMFAERGVTLIPVPDGVGFLAEQFEAGHLADTVVVVGPDVPLSGTAPRVPAGPVRSRSGFDDLVRHPAIESHQIAGHAVLPLSFALGALIGAAEQACEVGVGQATGVRVLKGVVFDEQAPVGLDLELTPGPVPSGAGQPGSVTVTARSVLADGRQRPAYQATLSWAANEPPVAPPVPAGSTAADHLYRDGTLFHGSELRGITGFVDTPHPAEELVLSCRLADLAVPGHWSGTAYSPVLFDLLLQACLVWVRSQTDSPSLPMGIAQADLYAPLPDDEPFTVAVRGVLRDSTRASCDVIAQAADGRVLQRLSGVELVFKPEFGASANSHQEEG
ncbi:MAG TPA: SDR family NAD(P)-dependent oxidoreductase, partial [Kineosporiaceae bacterium]|nr:SDR family NAD(P)-dependent oxidoreductase [Kineosporiaceae bacterium]